MQALVRWERRAQGEPSDFDVYLEHALARTVPEYRGHVEAVFAPGTPDSWPSCGAWRCLSNAVDVVRETETFDGAILAALELPDDTRNLATVVGAIAGARYGARSIPTTMTDSIRGEVSGASYGTEELTELHDRLVRAPSEPLSDNAVIQRIKDDVRAGVPISTYEELFLRRFGFDSVIELLDARFAEG